MILLIYEVFILFVFVVVLALDINSMRTGRGDGIYTGKKIYAPRVLVILPAKGYDLYQKDNFLSLKKQNYSNYNLVAVVDSINDPAAKTARRLGILTLVARGKCSACSGKSRAIAYALRRFKDYDIYVIADSDVMAKRDWLSKLIAPLSNPGTGISTTFPTFMPVDHGLWSYVKMLWGVVGKSLMSSRLTRFGWGGSLAFKRDVADEKLLYMLTHSRYAVSDDINITRRAKELGLSIAYVKDAEPVVYVKETKESFVEWANRQTALTLLVIRTIFT